MYKQLNLLLEEKELIVICRLLFNGKTETLVSLENEKKVHLSEDFKDNVKIVEDNVEFLKYLFKSKTSGWTTSFLNFAIDEIDKRKGEKTFESVFKEKFEELHAIIASTKI